LLVLLIRSLLLCRDRDGVDVVEDRQWISLLMFEDSLALLDRLYRLSVFRERLKLLKTILMDAARGSQSNPRPRRLFTR
jgi:hypothetical protein